MRNRSLARARLVSQGLACPGFATPHQAVASFGAMQGQDLPGVVASATLRVSGGVFTEVLHAFDHGELVRGYPMRGTVFLTAAEDLAWMTQLCAGQAIQAARRRRDQLGIDERQVERASSVARSVLDQRLGRISRAGLYAAWQEAGLSTGEGRGYHLLYHLIATVDLCYGPWNGTEQDIVAAPSWLPAGSTLEARFNGDRIAATAELLHRYLTSRGPATLRDFAWWTKLPLREIRAAFSTISTEIELADPSSKQPGAEPRYQRPGLSDEVSGLAKEVARPLLLPGFDEFILGYPDRLFAMSETVHQRLVPGNNGVFQRSVVINGEVRALWRRLGQPHRRELAVETPERPLSKAHTAAVERLFACFPFVAA